MTIREQLILKAPDKRRFLQGLAAVLGSATVSGLCAGSALANALTYQAKPDSSNCDGVLFSQSQMKTLAAICQTVIPKTDTPSAAELDVHGFIDHQLVACYSKSQQQQAKQLIDTIDSQSVKRVQKVFYQLSTEQQTELLADLENQFNGFSQQASEQFSKLKALMVFGYFTTEVGATQALSYQAVPGGFKGVIPYQSVGKAYGSLGFY